MAKIAKMDTKTQVMSSADKIYYIFKNEAHHLPKFCPEKIKDVKLLQGDGGTVGSLKIYTYVVDGNEMSATEMVEAVDEDKKMMKFNIIDGEILRLYKSIKATLQASIENGGNYVKWSIEFEKWNEDVPNPDAYLEYAANITRDIDDTLFKAQY